MDPRESLRLMGIASIRQNQEGKLTNPEFFYHHMKIHTKLPQPFQGLYNQIDLYYYLYVIFKNAK